MPEKTPKQKCLEMWEWLADNPPKKMQDYAAYLYSEGKEDEYYHCWACKTADERSALNNTIDNCEHCPITWPGQFCTSIDSSYYKWYESNQANQRAKYAKQLITLIKETWKD